MNLNDAARMARQMMNEHGLTDWKFEWGWGMRRFGCCRGGRKEITLSQYLVPLNTQEHVRIVMLHEIAHALVGARHHHDVVWQSKCVELGIDPDRILRMELVVPEGTWIGQCPNCGKESHKFSKPTRRKSCGRCCPGRFNVLYEYVWRNPGFDPRRTMVVNARQLEEAS